MDGELPLDLSGPVLKHLQACAACQCKVDGLRGVGKALRTLAVPAPAGLGARILAEARVADVVSGAERFGFASALPRVAALLAGAAAATLLFSMPTTLPVGDAVARGSEVHRLLTESQSNIELAGSFDADFRLLAARPEGRLMHESMGAGR